MKPTDVPKRLGKRVGALRRERRYTQEQLAERCGFTVKFISRIERGIVNVPLVTLASVAAGLGATMSELLLGVDVAMPRELQTLEHVYAGRPRHEQAAISRVLTAVADLVRASKEPPEGLR